MKDVTHKGNISAYDYNDEDGSSKLMTDKDKEFVDKSQHAAVDANDYAKDVYDYYKINLVENHTMIREVLSIH